MIKLGSMGCAEGGTGRRAMEALASSRQRSRKALGMVEGEGLRAAAQRVVKERDASALSATISAGVFLVHGSLGIQQGEHIGNAIDALKKERDELATRLRHRASLGVTLQRCALRRLLRNWKPSARAQTDGSGAAVC